MALFQRNPYDTKDNKPYYTLGLERTILIVGLGNKGKKYDGTRHNIGFVCVDALANAYDISNWSDKKDLKCLVATGNYNDTRVILAKPSTYMNLSGEALEKVSKFYKVPLSDILIVHDDLDLNFGQIRCRNSGSDGGHNGLKSIIDRVGENFSRVRIGIGPRPTNKNKDSGFVLAKFTKSEQAKMADLKRETVSIVTEYLAIGKLTSETRSFIV